MRRSLALFRKDIKSVKWVIIAIITYFVFFRRLWGGFCPVVKIFGIPCPSCGFTRAGLALLHLDFKRAWEIHPLIYGVVILAVLFLWDRYVLLGAKSKYVLRAAYLLVAVMAVFYLYRMYVYFPGDPPMSYYHDNVIRQVFTLLRSASDTR